MAAARWCRSVYAFGFSHQFRTVMVIEVSLLKLGVSIHTSSNVIAYMYVANVMTGLALLARSQHGNC